MATDSQDRIAGLLYGSLVGDALALGAHWIYDQEELQRDYGRVSDYLDPRADSYHPARKRGQQTHYGDQALTLMRSLHSHGRFDLGAFAADWARMWEGYPDYFDHATKETLAHLKAGRAPGDAASGSDELGGAARIAPLLAAMAERPVDSIVAAARAQTALTHGSAIAGDAAEFLARLSMALVNGGELRSSINAAADGGYAALDVRALVDRAASTDAMSVTAAAEKLGLACPAPKALPTLLMLLQRCGDDFESALIENVMAGGDNAARGLALGMILGARYGKAAIPKRWLRGLEAAPEVNVFLARR